MLIDLSKIYFPKMLIGLIKNLFPNGLPESLPTNKTRCIDVAPGDERALVPVISGCWENSS
jgi:hypothetical protein